MADATWERLKEKRKKSGKSWNLFLLSLLQNKKFSPKNSNHNGASAAGIENSKGELHPPDFPLSETLQ